MTDKQLLIKEINKIYEYGNIGFRSLPLLDIINEMKNNITSKKILIKNDYGLLGNLLYKYRFDKDIYEYIYQLECKFIINILKKGDNYIDYILNINKNKTKKYIVINEKYTDIMLTHINDKILEDRKMVLEIVKYDGNVLKYVQNDFQNDKEIVYEAVKQNGLALQYAIEELKKDKEIVLEAVKQNGLALQYETSDLKNNKEVVLNCIKNQGLAFEFLPETFKSDKTILQETIESLKNDEKIPQKQKEKLNKIDINNIEKSIKKTIEIINSICSDPKNPFLWFQ